VEQHRIVIFLGE